MAKHSDTPKKEKKAGSTKKKKGIVGKAIDKLSDIVMPKEKRKKKVIEPENKEEVKVDSTPELIRVYDRRSQKPRLLTQAEIDLEPNRYSLRK